MTRMRLAPLLLALLLPVGCGRGGGGGGLLSQPPTLHVAFPGPSCLTDQPTIRVRGEVTGDGVTEVWVGGVPALLPPAPAREFEVTVPLVHGVNVLDLAIEESGGVRTPWGSLRVKRVNGLMPAPGAIAAEPSGSLIAINGRAPTHVYRVDPITGVRTLLSDGESTAWPRLVSPTDAVVTASGDIYVTDRTQRAVVHIHPTTGARTIVSGPDPFDAPSIVGSGPLFESPQGLALFHNGLDVAVVDRSAHTLVRVSLATGDRVVLSDGDDGQAAPLVSPADVVVAPGDATFYVSDLWSVIEVDGMGRRVVTANGDGQDDIVDGTSIVQASDGTLYLGDRGGRIFEVDPVTGTRTSAASTPAGDPIHFRPVCMAFEASGTMAVVHNFLDGVFRVDLASGQHTAVSNATLGSGTPYYAMTDVAHSRSGQILVADANASRIHRVDPDTGNRTALVMGLTAAESVVDGEPGAHYTLQDRAGDERVSRLATSGTLTLLSSPTLGTGEPLSLPPDLERLPSGALLVVSRTVQPASGALVQVDPATGERTLLSGAGVNVPSRGTGTAFVFPSMVTVDGSGAIYVGDDAGPNLSRVLTVDPGTGDRDELATGFGLLGGLCTASDGSLRLVDRTARTTYRIDPSDGSTEVLSSPLRGTGILPRYPIAVTIDSLQRLLVADRELGAILAIDPVTGDRVIVSH